MLHTLIIFLTFNFLILGCGFQMAQGLYSWRAIRSESWLELVAVGSGLLIIMLSLFGLFIAIVPWSLRHIFSLGGFSLLLIINIYLFAKSRLWNIHWNASNPQRIFYIGFLFLSLLSIYIANLPVKLPENLPDGAYVAKSNILPVRIQFLTGNLPADNSIPHVVSQYLLQDISFEENRPILPGQEVTNRPILMSLVTLPFAAALKMPERLSETLPTFSYVAQNWPDFRTLINDLAAYRISLTVGIILNALLLLGGAILIGSIFPITTPIAIACVLSVISSPFFLFQTIFIWPKSMAGFFIAVGLFQILKRKEYILGGFMLGAAYLSHPYAAAFIMGVYLLLVVIFLKDYFSTRSLQNLARDHLKAIIIFSLSLILIISPWWIWAKWMVHLPSSNLVEQNLFIPGQSWINFIWIRIVNFSVSFIPFYWFTYPFNLRQFIGGISVNAVGACGVIAYLFFFRTISNLSPSKAYPYVLTIGIPTAFLVSIFSVTTVPAIHGLQLPIMLILLTGCIQVLRAFGVLYGTAIIAIQCVINGLLLIRYFQELF